jgi:hypothetical protein
METFGYVVAWTLAIVALLGGVLTSALASDAINESTRFAGIGCGGAVAIGALGTIVWLAGFAT